MRRVALSAALCASLGCSSWSRVEGIDPERVPPALRADHALFTDRCSRCHSLSVPLQAHVSDRSHWERYVSRMRRQPNSGITLDDEPGLLRFLFWYTEARRAPGGGSL